MRHAFRIAAVAAIITLLCAAVPCATGGTGPDLSTPRATCRTFLEAMNAVRAGHADRLDDALACMYFDDPGQYDRDARARLAQNLYEIIDFHTLSLYIIPERVDGKRYELVLRSSAVAPPLDEVTLLLFEYNDGRWRFQSQTIDQIPMLYAGLEAHRAVVPAEPGETDPDLASPRATMRTFIEGMNRWQEGGLEEALRTLDLSQVRRQVRAAEGERLAVLLKRVLDRHRLIIYQEIPDRTQGEPYVHLRHDAGNIAIGPVAEDDVTRWLFTAKTLETLPELYRAFEDRPVLVEGGEEFDTPALRLRQWVRVQFPFLLSESLFLENWQWLGLFLIILAGMTFSRLAAFAIVLLIRRRFRVQEMVLDKDVEKRFVRPIRLALMAWVWYLGLNFLGLPADILFYLRGAAQTVSAVGAVLATYYLVDILGRYLAEKASRTANRFDDILVPLVIRSLKVFVIAFGIVFVAETLDIPYRSMLAGLGLGGLAFALAAKDTISNVFGSLTVLTDQPFNIGDWVIIGDVEGSVESVGIRSTRIRTFYNSLVTMPNAQLINATVDNMGARRYRRTRTLISLTYDTPPEKVEAFCEGIRELIRANPYTWKDFYEVWLSEFGPSSINVLVYCFHECTSWSMELRERHRLYLDIIRLTRRLGVEFAFPTQTLYMRPDDGERLAEREPRPSDANEAHVLGRREAQRIYGEQLGSREVTPPPPAQPDTARDDETTPRPGFDDGGAR